jgi:hypothetical protein
MIVLDEQLLGYGLQAAVARWYRGRVIEVTQLRPGTVIHDEAIPVLLRRLRLPTFVTINVQDFWRRMAPDRRYCLACFAVPDTRAEEVATLLRRLLSTQPFGTRRGRVGKIVRVSQRQIKYYGVDSWAVRIIDLGRRK